MIDYVQALNDEQREVVMQEGGPILVIAGAGSGKTRALTYRVARLMEVDVPQENILLATFTNKAARTMLSRVQSLVEQYISHLWGGTFHHIANLMLRTHAYRLGYDRNYSILDAEDARQLIRTCISEVGMNPRKDGFPQGDVIRDDVIRDMVSLSVNTDTPLEEVVADRYPYFEDSVEGIADVANLYHRHKKEQNVMDFDDLLFNCRRILIHFPEVQTYYSDRFHHILVDEYQDTNIIQADIIDLLAVRHRNIVAVGDDSQSIYSFRGAHYANIIQFPEKYPDCRIFKLETNYRSTPEILKLANISIVHNENQFEKTLRPVKDKGIKPVVVPARNVIQQAGFVAQRIEDLIGEGVPLSEMAVLYRAHYHSMELQMELTRRGIPYEIRSGIRFFEQAHIKDVVSFLRILVNPSDELAWKRLLGLHEKVGKVTADKIWTFLLSKPRMIEAALTPDMGEIVGKAARKGIEQFQFTLKAVVSASEKQSASGVIETIVRSCYDKYLKERYPDAISRLEDLDQLAQYAQKFTSMDDFLSELALLTNMAAEEGDPVPEENSRIILSTIHQAKGLEWSVVFLIGCADGMIPRARAIAEEGEEEERRLFYVATTRAKDQLYFCYPLVSYSRGNGAVMMQPSRFIQEIERYMGSRRDHRLYDQWRLDNLW
ncbi:MAG: ATP-dependent helicase [Syntrophales bacterium]